MTTPLRSVTRLGALVPLIALPLAMLPGASALAAVPSVAYVVTYSTPPSTQDLEVLSGIASQVHGYQLIPAAVAVINPTMLPLLRDLPGVQGVYPDDHMQLLDFKADQAIKADQAWGNYSGGLGYTGDGITGAGIGIAVVDAGIDGTHPDLCAAAVFCKGTPVKTVQNVKFIGDTDQADPVVAVENQLSTDTTSGHGSHVAGIAAGFGTASQTPGKYQGVAPGASLIGLGAGEAIDVINVLAGFDYILTHRDIYNIKVINNSWGPSAGTPYDAGHPVNLAIDAAWNDGITVVFGAGNDGPKTDTLNMFSVNPHAISVAGSTKDGENAFFSSRGIPGSSFWRPTVTAPGNNIVSARALTGTATYAADATSANPDPIDPADTPYYANVSGTSMSSPHVAGVVALMQQAAYKAHGTYLTPQQVKNILQNTAQNGATGSNSGMPRYQDWEMGAGVVNAYAAVQAATNLTNLQAYDSHTVTKTKAFTGDISSSAIFVAGSFDSTFTVAPGATSLEVLADWKTAQDDVDISVTDPTGAGVGNTFLLCNPASQPNGYSSFCSSAANERLSYPNPIPGTWSVHVYGNITSPETVHGMWSAVYPSATTGLPADATPASVTLTVDPTTPAVAGQPVNVTAVVKDAAGIALPNAPVSWTSTGVGAVRGESWSHEAGQVASVATSPGPGNEVVTVTSGSATASTTISWLGVTLPAPPPGVGQPADSPGKASGGGWITVNGAKQHFSVSATLNSGASQPGGQVAFDDHAGTSVSASSIDHFRRPTTTTATFTGPCTVNGAAGYHFSIDVADNGEPGKGHDTFHIHLTKDLDPTWSYDAQGTLGGGNIQVKSA